MKVKLLFSPESQAFPDVTQEVVLVPGVPVDSSEIGEDTADTYLDDLSNLILAFFLEWQQNGLIVQEPSGTSEENQGPAVSETLLTEPHFVSERAPTSRE
jgi:hypothetical protein